jgi:predicted secreted protein
VVGAEGALLDAAGLVGAVILSTLTIEDHHRLLFVALLLGVGWTCWLVAAQYRSLTTILTKQNPRLLLAPVFAPLVALVLQALARGYYSLSSLALYGAIWGCWMLVVRALGIRKQPPVSVLVPGSPAYLPALRRLPRVALITSSTPPATFKGIDVVITEPMEAYSVEWMQWFVHADLAGVRLLSAPLAMEHLTGRTPVESLWDRWAEACPAYACIAERSSAVLNAMFPPGDERYLRLQVGDAGASGWAVLSDTQMTGHRQFGGMRVGAIIDCLATPGHEPAVVAAAERALVERGVDIIVSNQMSERWTRSFDARGFVRGPSNFYFAASQALAKRLAPLETSARQAHLTRGDGDGPVHLVPGFSIAELVLEP